MDETNQLRADIRSSLTDDLRKPKYRSNPNPIAGHCYVASEALYHLYEGNTFTPMVMRIANDTHWFLKCRDSGKIVDITADQFDFPIDYSTAKGSGFLTRNPSKRALKVIERVKALTDLRTKQDTL